MKWLTTRWMDWNLVWKGHKTPLREVVLWLYELYLAARITIRLREKVFQRDTQLVGAGGQRWRAIISSYEPRETALRISSPWLYRKPPLYHLSFIKPTLCNCINPQWGPTSKTEPCYLRLIPKDVHTPSCNQAKTTKKMKSCFILDRSYGFWKVDSWVEKWLKWCFIEENINCW